MDPSSVPCPGTTNKSIQVKPIKATSTAVLSYFCLFAIRRQKACCLLVLYHNRTHRFILTSGHKVIHWLQLQPDAEL